MKVFLDGIPLAYPTDNLLEPKFTDRRQNDDGEFSVSFTGELVFTGTDYDYLYARLVTDPNAINQSVVLKFVDDCCNDRVDQFLIKPESLKWCMGSCELSATAVEYTPESQAYACLENTLVWDDYAGFQSASHPRMKYCLEYRPSLLQDLMIILGILTVSMIGTMIPVILTVLLIIGSINLIISAVNTLPGVNISLITIGGLSDPITIFQWGLDLFNQVNGLISGCGFEHPSPLVRSYITNVCNKCGLAFSSSILNESNSSKANHDYYNLVYFNAPIKAGRIGIPYFTKPLVPYITENIPIHNGKTFLDELKRVFNAKWDVQSGVVRFERVDFFQTQIPWFDITTYPKEDIIDECYEWSKKRRPAYANILYQRDALDWCGSEATDRFSDIVEWNSPVNPIQKGEFTQQFPYSTARYREDKIERDVLSDYEWAPFGIGTNIHDGKDDMIMNSGTSFTPKLLIWDGIDVSHGRVKRYDISGYGPGDFVNYPMCVDATLPGNLYDRFWAIENPRNASFSGYDYTIRIIWSCAVLQAININGAIMTSRGLSKTIDSMDRDYSTNTLTIRGTV